jgi:hypothetical protein
MTQKTVTLPSGASFEMQMVPFALGVKLQRVIANELKGVPITEGALGNLKDTVFQLLASEAMEQVSFEVLRHCLFNGEKVDRSTFEDEDRRQDYLPAVWEAVNYNLAPFVAGLVSLLPRLDGIASDTQK